MSTQTTGTSVATSIVVEAPVERCFAVYTEGIATWWPREHHIMQGVVDMVFEPRVGGRIYDRDASGAQSSWGRVLAYEPPHRVVFSWDITAQWQIESDPARSSEVEVRFTPESDGRTRVDLEHRHIDRHGEGWESMRDAVGSDNGWRVGLENFAARVRE